MHGSAKDTRPFLYWWWHHVMPKWEKRLAIRMAAKGLAKRTGLPPDEAMNRILHVAYVEWEAGK